MSPINVVVHGFLGKVGQEVLRTLCREPDINPVGASARRAEEGELPLPDGSGSIPVSSDLGKVLGEAQVVVDFTSGEGALSAIRTASARRVNVVVGSPSPERAGAS